MSSFANYLYPKLVAEVISCGDLAAAAHNKLFTGGFNVEEKSDGTPVTAVDHAINTRLSDWARSQSIGFVGEEGNGETKHQFLLHVDPLDGTIAFIRGMNTFTIIVTLMEMSEDHGFPIISIIYQPLGKRLWSTVDGSFTQFNGNTITLSAHLGPKIRSSICVFPGASHNLHQVLAQINGDPRFSDQPMGAFGIGAGLIVADLLDVTVIGATAAYESAAMAPIILNAGGVACDLNGNDLRGFKLGTVRGKEAFELPHGALFARNERITEQVLALIHAAQ